MQNFSEMFLNNNSKMSNEKSNDLNSSTSLTHTNLSEVNHVKQLSLDIGNLFNKTDYCDLKLIVEGEEFLVHRIILAARSEYFRALLFGGLKETSSDTIVIKDVRAHAFKLLLQYIYTGKLSLRNEREESLIDLLALVHQYGFVDLLKASSDYLESILNIENVCSIYDISSLYQLKSLEEKCARFIDRNCATLLNHKTLLQLSCDSLASIIGRDSFCVREIDIFKIVKEWHEHNSVAEPKRQLIEKIRLPLMELEEILNTVRQSNLIDSNQILDAIKLRHESKSMHLKHRGVLYPNENIATNLHKALVVKGEFKSALLDGDTNNYDFDRGFTYHTIDETTQNCIIVKLGDPTIFNQIKLLLWDKDLRSYSYYIEVSMDEQDWVRILDYSNYYCRSWQNLHFKPVVARYIKITGVRNTANRIFHLVSMEVKYTFDSYEISNNLIVPTQNVATIQQSAFVLEGVSRTRNSLINGDYKNYDWDSGYTCHQLGSGCICIQLAQPYIISSMRMLLWDCDNRSYSYYIETSLDQLKWTMVVDKRNENCRSWQVLTFESRAVSFIKITGTHNTANEVFHCVHFECPCDAEVLNRYMLVEKSQGLNKESTSCSNQNVMNARQILFSDQMNHHQQQQQQQQIQTNLVSNDSTVSLVSNSQEQNNDLSSLTGNNENLVSSLSSLNLNAENMNIDNTEQTSSSQTD